MISKVKSENPMDIEPAQETTHDETRQDIVVHSGTYEGSILGFHGTIKSQKNLYAFTPNRVYSPHLPND